MQPLTYSGIQQCRPTMYVLPMPTTFALHRTNKQGAWRVVNARCWRGSPLVRPRQRRSNQLGAGKWRGTHIFVPDALGWPVARWGFRRWEVFGGGGKRGDGRKILINRHNRQYCHDKYNQTWIRKRHRVFQVLGSCGT